MEEKHKELFKKAGEVYEESFKLQENVYSLVNSFITAKEGKELRTINGLLACAYTIGRIIGETVKTDTKDEDEAEFLINSFLQTISVQMSGEISKARYTGVESIMLH